MTHTKDVASRELCEEMARLGICQTEPEMWHCKSGTRNWVGDQPKYAGLICESIVAPALARMMEELPVNTFKILRWSDQDGKELWCVCNANNGGITYGEDMSLPNAVAKALIAIAKEKKG